jgi:hypothetical protein
VRIENVLPPPAAEALYRSLMCEVAWRTVVIANGHLQGTLPGETVSVELESEIANHAQQSTRHGFACVYDTDRILPEDEQPDGDICCREDGPAALVSLETFFNSLEFVKFCE